MFAVSFALFVSQSAMATVIIFDDFTGTDGTLVRNTTPDPGTGNSWSGSPGYTITGNAVHSATTGSGHFVAMDMGAGYFVDNPDVYEISADLFLSSTMNTPTDFFSVGFTAGNNTSAGANRTHLSTNHATLTGSPSIALRGNGQVAVKVSQAETAYISSTGDYAAGSTYNVRVVLDTTLTNWSVAAFVDNTQLDLNGVASGLLYEYTTNPTIRYASISSGIDSTDSAGSYLDNFQLQTIPEPSTLVLSFLSLLGFVAVRRKRLA